MENMPSTELCDDDFTDGKIMIGNLLVKCGLCPSSSEARRLVKQGGVSVNDVKVTDFATGYDKAFFANGEVMIKKGKKDFHKVSVK